MWCVSTDLLYIILYNNNKWNTIKGTCFILFFLNKFFKNIINTNDSPPSTNIHRLILFKKGGEFLYTICFLEVKIKKKKKSANRMNIFIWNFIKNINNVCDNIV